MLIWEQITKLASFIYWNVMHAAYKWFLHIFTGRSEIERCLLESTKVKHRARTVTVVENSLLRSKNEALSQLATAHSCRLEPTQVAMTIVKIKAVDVPVRGQVQRPLVVVMEQIMGYYRLVQSVEMARSIPYATTNQEHEAKLIELWTCLMPEMTLDSRLSNDWAEIGFQGRDPATDFRGMGILALDQLVYFAKFELASARHLLTLSRHPKIGFPFAIAGVAMTALCRDLLRQGYLKNHFYNTVLGLPQIVDFHRVYCRVFTVFCDAWKQHDPSSVMEFNIVKDKFSRKLIQYSLDETAKLDSNFSLAALL